MASASGVNFVRYFFYAGNTISKQRKKALVALAYATARDQKLAPKAILIRADIHDTTTINGKHDKDPNGWHGTFAFKDDEQVKEKIHVASHGYVNGKEDFILKEATHSAEKNDSIQRRGGKVVWPDEDELEEYEYSPIGYSHIP
ncbi:hypothetical protein LZ32DRAFT_596750 [Colletotrichum eremochloae]|nr:hypothetical protein LZ32DRAFT_596750 [Colletotrichum eremochloae]